jgi:hypothetical protein
MCIAWRLRADLEKKAIDQLTGAADHVKGWEFYSSAYHPLSLSLLCSISAWF